MIILAAQVPFLECAPSSEFRYKLANKYTSKAAGAGRVWLCVRLAAELGSGHARNFTAPLTA